MTAGETRSGHVASRTRALLRIGSAAVFLLLTMAQAGAAVVRQPYQ